MLKFISDLFSPISSPDHMPLPKGFEFNKLKKSYTISNSRNEIVRCKFEFCFKEVDGTTNVEFIKKQFNLSELIKPKSGHNYHIFSIVLLSSESEYIKDFDLDIKLVYDARQAYSDKFLDDGNTSKEVLIKKGLIKEINENGHFIQNFKDEKVKPVTITYSKESIKHNKELHYSEFKEDVINFAVLAPLEKENLFPQSTEKNGRISIFIESPLFFTFICKNDAFKKYLEHKEIVMGFDIKYNYRTKIASFDKKLLNTFLDFLEETYYSKFKKNNMIQSTISVNFRETGEELVKAIKTSIDNKYAFILEDGETETDILDRHLYKTITMNFELNVTYCLVYPVVIEHSNIDIVSLNDLIIEKINN